ncbi:RING/U-box superfamily protein [Striga hermonthica]|uniref:RING/U-box superfamily protein n=1 Tax=Striga hermonthica TaxID=68872 RepID=A0A9N7RTP8_STRHE|nr:RING/U-box superfamily protein [Striga hermonthica]
MSSQDQVRRDHEGPSNHTRSQDRQAAQGVSTMPPSIDVEALDDDVVISSPRAFAEAKNNSRRVREQTIVVDLDSDERPTRYKRRRVSTNQTIINCDLYINLDGSGTSKRKSVQTVTLPPSPPPPPPPPKEPKFSCPEKDNCKRYLQNLPSHHFNCLRKQPFIFMLPNVQLLWELVPEIWPEQICGKDYVWYVYLHQIFSSEWDQVRSEPCSSPPCLSEYFAGLLGAVQLDPIQTSLPDVLEITARSDHKVDHRCARNPSVRIDQIQSSKSVARSTRLADMPDEEFA